MTYYVVILTYACDEWCYQVAYRNGAPLTRTQAHKAGATYLRAGGDCVGYRIAPVD